MAIFADQENNSTRVVSGKKRVVGLEAAEAAEAANNANNLVSFKSDQHQDTMEYAWLEPIHDPIVTDTNLAEIDFENFKNEDLAYAFSCGVSNFLHK